MLNLHMTSSSPLEFLWILCLRSHADAKAYDRNGRITALVKLGQRPGGRGWEGWTTLTVEIVEVVPKKTQNQRKLVEFSSIKFSIFCETCPNTSFRGASQHGKIEDVNVAVDAVGGEAGCLSFGTHRTTLHQNLKIMKLIYHNMFNLRMMLDRQRIKTQNNMYIYIQVYIIIYPYLSVYLWLIVDINSQKSGRGTWSLVSAFPNFGKVTGRSCGRGRKISVPRFIKKQKQRVSILRRGQKQIVVL